MPLIESEGPGKFINGHIETIVPALFRNVKNVPFKTQRLELPDDDFLDIDTIVDGNSKAVIISHGLEGSSRRPYVTGMAKYLSQQKFDIFAWNYRGCSGEINRQKRFYHSGATDDLDQMVKHVLDQGYKQVFLVGFSLGGNLTLKYLGEERRDRRIVKAAVFSVPMHLHSSCIKLSKGFNSLYSRRFLKHLKQKVEKKAELMPDAFDLEELEQIRSLIDFDDKVTAPLHGFRSAIDYYESCSSLYFLENIDRPVLIVNAKNDSFLSDKCYPTELASKSEFIHLETPTRGGHVGFAGKSFGGHYWSEIKASEFFN